MAAVVLPTCATSSSGRSSDDENQYNVSNYKNYYSEAIRNYLKRKSTVDNSSNKSCTSEMTIENSSNQQNVEPLKADGETMMVNNHVKTIKTINKSNDGFNQYNVSNYKNYYSDAIRNYLKRKSTVDNSSDKSCTSEMTIENSSNQQNGEPLKADRKITMVDNHVTASKTIRKSYDGFKNTINNVSLPKENEKKGVFHYIFEAVANYLGKISENENSPILTPSSMSSLPKSSGEYWKQESIPNKRNYHAEVMFNYLKRKSSMDAKGNERSLMDDVDFDVAEMAEKLAEENVVANILLYWYNHHVISRKAKKKLNQKKEDKGFFYHMLEKAVHFAGETAVNISQIAINYWLPRDYLVSVFDMVEWLWGKNVSDDTQYDFGEGLIRINTTETGDTYRNQISHVKNDIAASAKKTSTVYQYPHSIPRVVIVAMKDRNIIRNIIKNVTENDLEKVNENSEITPPTHSETALVSSISKEKSHENKTEDNYQMLKTSEEINSANEGGSDDRCSTLKDTPDIENPFSKKIGKDENVENFIKARNIEKISDKNYNSSIQLHEENPFRNRKGTMEDITRFLKRKPVDPDYRTPVINHADTVKKMSLNNEEIDIELRHLKEKNEAENTNSRDEKLPDSKRLRLKMLEQCGVNFLDIQAYRCKYRIKHIGQDAMEENKNVLSFPLKTAM